MADKDIELTLKINANQTIQPLKDTETGLKRVDKAHKNYNETLDEQGQYIRKLNKNKRELAKIQDLEAQAANSAEGSYDQLSAQYRLNVIALNKVNTEVGEATDETLELVAATAEMRLKMDAAKVATNDFSLRVGNYKDEMKAANGVTAKLGVVGKHTFKSVGKVGKVALKGIGTALKGMGIGLIIAGLSALWEAVKKNQKVMDAFKTVVNAVGLVIRPVIDGIGDLIEGISSGSKEFDAIGKVIKGLINLALIPLKISFNQIKLGIQFIILGWLEVKKALGGDVDNGRIEQLRKDIDKTKESTKALVEEAKGSVKSIVSNVGEAIGEIGDLGSKVADGMKQAVEDVKNGAARAATEAAKALELLDAEQEKLKLQFQKRAEVYRQGRDDESKQIADRIIDNENLGKVLLEQANSEAEAVNKKIKAQLMLNKIEGDTIEGQKRIAELRNELIEIDERITSQQSEQLTNLNALNKEKLELEKAFLIAKQELTNDLALEAAATEEERELLKAEQDAEKKALELENMILEAEERTELEALLLEQKENTLQEIKDKYIDINKKKQADADKAELKAQETKNKLKESAENSIVKSLLNLSETLFGKTKAAALAGLVVEKGAAIGKIFANLGIANAKSVAASPLTAGQPWVGINTVSAGLSTAAVVAEAAKGANEINKPKLARGGYHYGATHAGGGIDLGAVEVQNREFTVNSNTMNNPQLRGIVETANAIGNGEGGSLNMGISREEAMELIKTGIEATPVYVLEQDITETQRTVQVRESEFNG